MILITLLDELTYKLRLEGKSYSKCAVIVSFGVFVQSENVS